MPKSKRAQLVSLTRTTKQTKEAKTELIENIRTCLSQYTNLYVFGYQNMDTPIMDKLRLSMKGTARFFIARNTVMQVALGRTPETEARPDLAKVSKLLSGSCGLMFTNLSRDEVEQRFTSATKTSFASSGELATETVELKEGPIPLFPHNMEPHLRDLGLPTKLVDAVVHLNQDHVVCRKGDKLTPNQCRILRHLGMEMSAFRLFLIASWHGGALTSL
jgi:mRNA turnover protein 4